MLRTQFDPKQRYRVVIYVRMSTDQQNPRSPDQQIANIKELIQKMNLNWTVVATYRDDGISGRRERKRSDYGKMLSDLRSGAVQAELVLVDTFERLSRADNAAELRRKLQKAGVLVLTADSGFADPTSTSGKALAMIESFRAAEEGRVKAHNVLRGKKDAVRRKQWAGGPPPMGFRLRSVMVTKSGTDEVDHRRLEPDPETRCIVEEIFRLADEKAYGTTRLAKQLNQDPRIADSLKPFHPATIGHVLDNELYYGEMVWGKNCTGIVDDVRILEALPESEWERIPEYCPPIISRDLWDRVQAIREERRRRHIAARSQDGETVNKIPGLRAPGIVLKYVLTGLVRCRHCGRSMTPSGCGAYHTRSGEERRYVAYVCPGHPAKLCPNGRRVPEPWLRETVLNLVRQRLLFGEV